MTEALTHREPNGDITGVLLLSGLLLALGFLASWTWFFIVVAIIFMIFMHEMGHYLTARWTGMKTTEFFIGFGPRLWSFRRGETEYGVKAIPAGAYVRIEGMNNLEEVPEEDEPRTYRAKSFPRKLLVVSAGSIMHFLMALVLLYAFFVGWGDPSDPRAWEVGSVSSQSAALDLGTETGDVIVSLDGVKIDDFDQFGGLVRSRGGETVDISYLRDGESILDTVVLGGRLSDAGADAFGGLLENDRILQIDGVDVSSWDDVLAQLDGKIGKTISVVVDPVDGVELQLFDDIEVNAILPANEAVVGFFGISQKRIAQDVGAIEGIGRSVTGLGQYTKLAFENMWELITGGGLSNFVSDTVTGNTESAQEQLEEAANSAERESAGRLLDTDNPDEDRILSIYGAARAGTILSGEGFENALVFLAGLNIFIGIFNMFPFPPLDGGHVVVAVYERIRSIGGRRHRVDYNKLIPLTYAVFLVLVGFGLLALFRDIIDPINLG